MTIEELQKTLNDMRVDDISKEQAWVQIKTTKNMIIETIEPIVQKLKLEMTIKLGSIMALSVLLTTGIIGIFIFMKG